MTSQITIGIVTILTMMTTMMQSNNNVEIIPSVSEGMDKLGI